MDAAGNAYVAGSTRISASRSSTYVATWDTRGRLRWTRGWIGGTPPKVTEFNDVVVNAAGRAWVAGSFLSKSGYWDWLVARFKPGGSVAWSRTWASSGTHNDSCNSLCLAGTGGLFAGGTVGGSGFGGRDAMAAKYIR